MQGRILIVEDEEAMAAFIQTALEREGFSAEWVGDAPDDTPGIDFVLSSVSQ